jgi:hypothetical protein
VVLVVVNIRAAGFSEVVRADLWSPPRLGLLTAPRESDEIRPCLILDFALLIGLEDLLMRSIYSLSPS